MAAIGIKDIREAFISFKRYPEKPKKVNVLKEDNDLLEKTLKWFNDPYNPTRVQTIPLKDQESMIKMYISKLGAGRYEVIFKREGNKHNANAVEFLTKTLKSELDKT